MTEAYFISFDGEIIPVVQSHILRIIDNPALFGLTREYIEGVFTKFNEPLGVEGQARAEIISLLLGRGWIRLRYFPRQDSLTVQIDEMTEIKWKHLREFARSILQDKKFGVFTEVKIINLIPRTLEITTLGEMSENQGEEL